MARFDMTKEGRDDAMKYLIIKNKIGSNEHDLTLYPYELVDLANSVWLKAMVKRKAPERSPCMT